MLAGELEALRGVRVPAAAFDTARLPPHLRMTFSVEDEAGRVVAAGNDLDALREAVRPRLRAELAAATRELERSGLTGWTLGTLPRTVALPRHRAGGARLSRRSSTRARPSACACSRRPRRRRAAMRAGTRRLLLLAVAARRRARSSAALSERRAR